MTWCLKGSPGTYAVPEAEALEENLITRFPKIHAKNCPTANAQSVRVRKLSLEARVHMKGYFRSGRT